MSSVETVPSNKNVFAPAPDQPLRQFVSKALQNYFHQLDGHAPANLYELVMEEVEIPLIQAVLEYTRGNQSKAAAILGISRSTLRKKLQAYNL
ncbi:MAG: DNA-binding transcriptional regulator Fis [Gammaproteobacteria bacterium]